MRVGVKRKERERLGLVWFVLVARELLNFSHVALVFVRTWGLVV